MPYLPPTIHMSIRQREREGGEHTHTHTHTMFDSRLDICWREREGEREGGGK